MSSRDIPTGIAVAIAVVLALRGCNAGAELAVAEAARAHADSVLAETIDELGELRTDTDAAELADSLEHVALLDSVAAARLRAAVAEEAVDSAVARADRARARRHETADSLAATLTTAQRELFAAHLADDDSVEAALVDRAEAAESKVDAVETENAALWRRLETSDSLAARALRERDLLLVAVEQSEDAMRARDRENAALRRSGNVWKAAAALGATAIVVDVVRGR